MGSPPKRCDRITWTITLLTGLACLVIGLSYLYRAHPNEDAYILFKYVRNLADGHGIVYYPTGPHAEGTIDFLWVLILSGMHWIGVDIALSACLLNALGGALIAFLICSAVARTAMSTPARLCFSLLGPCVALFDGLVSGYFGFSTMLYGALALSLSCWSSWARERLPWLPLMALLLGLFRADGVILGVGFTLIGSFRARRMGLGSTYWASCGAAICLGLLYVVWRRAYFGLDLPLPLYVKEHAAHGGGVLQTAWLCVRGVGRWMVTGTEVWATWLGLVVLGLVSAARKPRETAALALGLGPFLAMLALLTLAHQSQNIAGRFQAPAALAALFTLISLALMIWRAYTSVLLRACALLCPALVLVPNVALGWRYYHSYRDLQPYVDTFAPRFGAILRRNRVIALTEAGRLGYWTDAPIEDIVGLNTARTALGPATVSYLDGVRPDVIVFHVGLIDIQAKLADHAESVVAITAGILREGTPRRFDYVFEADLEHYSEHAQSDETASILLARFLILRDDYDVYAVRYAGRYTHVYGIRRGLEEAPELLQALELASSGGAPYRSYAEIMGFWGTRSD